jgi:hypothetical protein
MELSEPLLEEAGDQSEYGRPHDFVSIAERFAPGDEPGAPREWLLAHVEALTEESGYDEESFRTDLDGVTTDSETWVDDRAVYEVGGDRLSAYPPAWHETIGGSTSLVEIVRYLLDESDYQPITGGAGDGVTERDLFDVASAVGGFTREEAKAALEECREDGTLAEDADQHPRAKVYPPESDVEPDARPE